MKRYEVNFDGLVGPSHSYAGLSYGNLASTKNQRQKSNPREAALQGLRKMKALADLGLRQAVLPPQERPNVKMLRQLGFTGNDEQVIELAAKEAPAIFRACCSASSMWAANSATVTPSTDTPDQMVHFTPANLAEKFHRSMEWETTSRVLKTIFYDETHFVHHAALPTGSYFGDEGAANHTRFALNAEERGLHFFVYGKQSFGPTDLAPKKFPARQSLEASQAVARLHGLNADQTLFAQQNPLLVDAGVFHNDVVAVGNDAFFLAHEQAYVDTGKVFNSLQTQFKNLSGCELKIREVKTSEVSIEDAVRSYLFNSQLVTISPGKMVLISPEESQNTGSVKALIQSLVTDPQCPIESVRYFDLRESMSNGGGPACLRFRVVLSEAELAGAMPGVFLTDTLFQRLCQWVSYHYRDTLSPDDLADPALLREGREALDELTKILGLGFIYDFQR